MNYIDYSVNYSHLIVHYLMYCTFDLNYTTIQLLLSLFGVILMTPHPARHLISDCCLSQSALTLNHFGYSVSARTHANPPQIRQHYSTNATTNEQRVAARNDHKANLNRATKLNKL